MFQFKISVSKPLAFVKFGDDAWNILIGNDYKKIKGIDDEIVDEN